MLDRPSAHREIRRYRFHRHDRLRIAGEAYRVAETKNGKHVLQLVVGDVIEQHFIVKSDEEIGDLLRARRLIIEEGYFSKSLAMLKLRQDVSDVVDVPEEDLRTMIWKQEWCERFAAAHRDLSASQRPNLTQESLDKFVASIRGAMDEWYLKQFDEVRRPGRKFAGGARKLSDYPSASALRGWIRLYRRDGLKGLEPHYGNSGNRRQLDERAVPFIEDAIRHYPALNRPSMQQIVDRVEGSLFEWNGRNSAERPITVSASAIRRRIHRIDPFIKTLGRYGPGKAHARFTPVGKGLRIVVPMQRVEMDDWEMDLFTLAARTSAWKIMSKAQRKSVPRIRCTATVAIDVATRCIVGFALSASAPSTPGSKTALHSVLVDKGARAKWAGASGDWPMHGRPETFVTDGGPAFGGEFAAALSFCRAERIEPDQDPRMRGTIEAFFRTFKAICRHFAGQSFANVVERGDYDGEKMASVTFQEIYKHCIRWIVDVYHNRPHRGLEGRTPYNAWNAGVRNRSFPPPLPTIDLTRAFGPRGNYRLDKNGVTIGRYSYASADLSVLHMMLGEQQVTTIQDTNDLGYILVVIPKHLVGRKEFPSGSQVLIGNSTDPSANGRILDEVAEEWTKLRAVMRNEKVDADVHRIRGNLALFADGHETRLEAEIVEHVATGADLHAVMHAIAQKGDAGRGEVAYGTATGPLGENVGRTVARPARIGHRPATARDALARPTPSTVTGQASGTVAPRTRPKPFGGSINKGGDDK